MAAAAGVTDALTMHLLCGIDTSDSAPDVAYAAARVAERMGAELTLAHVASTADRAVSAHRLDALADDIAAAFGIRPDVCTEPADRPVMVVPPGAASPTGSGVAVAYETLDASAGAVAVAAHLASALEERLTVIHVLPDPRSYTRPVLPMQDDVRSVVEDALDGEALELRHVFAYRLPAGHLAQTVAQAQPALLVVAAPQRGWRSLFRPSAGARLLRSASCPVVVVSERATVRSRARALAVPA